jgi:hypothetical protein
MFRLGMGAHVIRRKFVLRLRHAPIQSINIVQADTINGSVSNALLGLSGFHGCGYAAGTLSGKKQAQGRNICNHYKAKYHQNKIGKRGSVKLSYRPVEFKAGYEKIYSDRRR